ncbi:MAG: hypothetical protein IJN11_07245 [Oscillospiraceae bacterium]|nr:hypothetical protein [Oscillospiraceae bacterium]
MNHCMCMVQTDCADLAAIPKDQMHKHRQWLADVCAALFSVHFQNTIAVCECIFHPIAFCYFKQQKVL